MIITICSQATSEERSHLMTQVCRVTGSLHPITTTVMDEHELIILDGTHLEHEAQALLSEQAAVEHITRIRTPYNLVSRAFQAEDTSERVGTGHDCEQVIIRGTAPAIIAGPCAVENREQLLHTSHAVKHAGAQILRGGVFEQPRNEGRYL